MSSPVEKIKERLDIKEVVGSYLKLERAGKNFKAKCPFHNEKTPSFFVSPERGSFYCFGCGAKGDIFSFVEQFEGLDFPGTLKLLATRAGVTLERENLTVKSERDRLFKATEAALEHFENNLKSESEALGYLKKRGLKDQTITAWRIGWAKAEWRDLLDSLAKQGFSKTELLKAGLIKEAKRENGEVGTYDTFRSRLMFPIFDTSGRPIAFSGRFVGDESTYKVPPAKYLNSPETPIFSKSSVLYGLDRAKGVIRERDYTILVEGQFDMIMSHQAGFTNTVASSGTALTENHLKILKRFSDNLIVAYDADSAGFKAAIRAIILALSLGMSVKVAKLPGGSDPAELVVKQPQVLAKAIKDSKHVVNFYLETLLEKKLPARNLVLEVNREVLPFVAAAPSAMEQAEFVKTIAQALNLKEEALWADLRKLPKVSSSGLGNVQSGTATLSEKIKKSPIERRLFGWLYFKESEKSQGRGEAKDLRAKIERVTGPERLREIEAELSKDKEELIFEAEAIFSGADKLEGELNELLMSLEEEQLKQAFTKAMAELGLAERDKDQAKIEQLLKTCHELSQKLNQLSERKK